MNGSKNFVKGFDSHRMISFVHDPESKLQGFIAIHRGNGDKIPAFGATRFVAYNSLLEGLEDALRLSRLMSYKSAMAGLRYGGAKGVVVLPEGQYKKSKLLTAYADKINALNGRFITGADVGVSASDVKTMGKYSQFVVGVKVDPVKYTAMGLIKGLEVSLKEVFGNQSAQQRTFAIQGVGKIGSSIINLIYKEAKRIFITDIDKRTLSNIKKLFPKTVIVSPQEIYGQKADVFMPCALGNTLNVKTIPKIKSSIILGGANNQLTNSSVGELLFKLGILYAPDYVVNSGGLISVVDEYENKNFSPERIELRVNNIKTTMSAILKQSRIKNKPTNIIADQMAEKIFNNR